MLWAGVGACRGLGCKGACPLYVQIKTSKSRRMTLSGSEVPRPVCCCCCCCAPVGVLRVFKYVFNAFVLLFSFFAAFAPSCALSFNQKTPHDVPMPAMGNGERVRGEWHGAWGVTGTVVDYLVSAYALTSLACYLHASAATSAATSG